VCQSVNIRPTLLITIIGTWATLIFIILFVKIKEKNRFFGGLRIDFVKENRQSSYARFFSFIFAI
jgi:hypothetical protein